MLQKQYMNKLVFITLSPKSVVQNIICETFHLYGWQLEVQYSDIDFACVVREGLYSKYSYVMTKA